MIRNALLYFTIGFIVGGLITIVTPIIFAYDVPNGTNDEPSGGDEK